MRAMLAGAVALVLTATSGCRGDAAVHEMDPELNRMLEVPRYDPYERSEFFSDGMVLRSPPEGTVPYSAAPISLAVQNGRHANEFIESIPIPVTHELVEQGKAKFERTCAACHGILGTGDTVVASHMQRPPPSLHEERIVEMPNGRIYFVIKNGYGYMPAYASHLDTEARWAVVVYLRALQRSQHASLDELPPELAAAAQRELP